MHLQVDKKTQIQLQEKHIFLAEIQEVPFALSLYLSKGTKSHRPYIDFLQELVSPVSNDDWRRSITKSPCHKNTKV